MPKLEIGGGRFPTEGYEQLDIMAGPAVLYCYPGGVPYHFMPSDFYDEIRAVHVLEHIIHQGVIPTLMEWRRVCRPGGEMYVAVPNLLAFCNAYRDHPASRNVIATGIFGQDDNPQARHVNGYDMDTLKAVVAHAGWNVVDGGVADDHHTKWWKDIGVYDASIFVRAKK